MTDPRAAAVAALERALAAEDLEVKATPNTARDLAAKYVPGQLNIVRDVYQLVLDELALARSTWRNGIPIEPTTGTIIRNSILNLKRSE